MTITHKNEVGVRERPALRKYAEHVRGILLGRREIEEKTKELRKTERSLDEYRKVVLDSVNDEPQRKASQAMQWGCRFARGSTNLSPE